MPVTPDTPDRHLLTLLFNTPPISSRIENGFYYDFDYKETFTEKDLKKIYKARSFQDLPLNCRFTGAPLVCSRHCLLSLLPHRLSLRTRTPVREPPQEMAKIIRKDLPLRREEVTRAEACTRIEALNEPYKLEILDAIKTEPITIYHVGEDWWDLCAGPHVESTGALVADAIELETVAGAYWRGDETKPMLQRIYGTVRAPLHGCCREAAAWRYSWDTPGRCKGRPLGRLKLRKR